MNDLSIFYMETIIELLSNEAFEVWSAKNIEEKDYKNVSGS